MFDMTDVRNRVWTIRKALWGVVCAFIDCKYERRRPDGSIDRDVYCFRCDREH